MRVEVLKSFLWRAKRRSSVTIRTSLLFLNAQLRLIAGTSEQSLAQEFLWALQWPET